MLNIVTTKATEIDLEEIWLYTFEEWSEEQADVYYDELIDGIEKLIDHPDLGQSRDAIRSGYRSLQVNHHVVYYRQDEDDILIIRVLHERMLPSKHL